MVDDTNNNNLLSNDEEQQDNKDVEESNGSKDESTTTAVKTMDEVTIQYKKDLKTMDGEKRSVIKKIKSNQKGKKLKDSIASIEEEYGQKIIDLETRYKEEIKQIQEALSSLSLQPSSLPSFVDNGHNEQPKTITPTEPQDNTCSSNDDEEQKKKSKNEKIRLKREKQRQMEKQKELDKQNEIQNAGPTAKEMEIQYIQEQFLNKLSYRIQPIQADGNCLYRAIASQLTRIYNNTTSSSGNTVTYQDIRNLCAEMLEQNENEFAPFCEYLEDDTGAAVTTTTTCTTTNSGLSPQYQSYCNNVRNNPNAWGGHLEIRAISMSLQRPIVIYSMQNKEPLVVDYTTTTAGTESEEKEPIRVSYHLHYYALGEHYNEVVPK